MSLAQTVVPRIVAIGAGPANLSLAALLQSRHIPEHALRVYEARPDTSWHAGQILPGTRLQSEWYRDLVTLVDPTNIFSFANFLHTQGRLTRFVNSGTILPERSEFSAYLCWVADQMPFLALNTRCTRFHLDESRQRWIITLIADGKELVDEADHLVLGTGITPKIPIPIDNLGPSVCHANAIASNELLESARSVLVVGGGQSGAEVIRHVLNRSNKCERVRWITRDSNFRTLDTGHFSREFYSFALASHLTQMPAALRDRVLRENAYAGEGITPQTAEEIYALLYGNLSDGQRSTVEITVLAELQAIDIVNQKPIVTIQCLAPNVTIREKYDLVVLCTGYDDHVLPFARSNLTEASLSIGEDYSIEHVGTANCRVFVQSAAVATHGFGDSNFVSAPERNAEIINAIFAAPIFGTRRSDRFINSRPITS